MRQFVEELKDFFKKGDMVLLVLCLITSGWGVVIIASATSAEKFGSNVRYIVVQLLAIALGILIYAIISSVDMDFFAGAPQSDGGVQLLPAVSAHSLRHRQQHR